MLNPCHDVWSEHFVLAGDLILPREDDADAAYTHVVYNLNDPRKVEIRRFRRETIKEALNLLERGRPFLARLLQRASQTHNPGLIDEARIVEDALRGALRNLKVFVAVPPDAHIPCACAADGSCAIPNLLEEQIIEIEQAHYDGSTS